jgi:hypothetical protein
VLGQWVIALDWNHRLARPSDRVEEDRLLTEETKAWLTPPSSAWYGQIVSGTPLQARFRV